MEPSTKDISVIIPLLNERPALDELHRRLTGVLIEVARHYEILFVDDGSTDGSSEKLKELCALDPCIRYIRFRRNFGKSAALAAGFSAARFDLFVTIDADLQEHPEQLSLLIARLDEGYDLVSGWRYQRQDRFSKRLTSQIYNRVTSLLTGVRLHDINCGFKCYRRAVLDEVDVYGEQHRYIPVLASYRGFRLGEVEIEHVPRAHGRSRYGIERFFGGFFSLLTVILMTRYTNKPLHFFGVLGLSLAALGAVIDGYLIVLRVLFNQWLSNRPLLIIGTMFVIVGMQLILFGLLAEMVAFSYRRESDYSIVETSESPDQLGTPPPQSTSRAHGRAGE